ncbi:nucleoside hydrolase [Nocardiopsis mangrovi]|uniref:Nucleoside hydrolase n=1 Tax=Nocardiopsis mangrovi TaxID=1179818 RepID=A0ABV9DNZ0_9ACTN
MGDTRDESAEDLRRTPLIIDTDIGGDADDALAVAVAARCVPDLALLLTTDETGPEYGPGQRARFARHLLDGIGRHEVPVVAGACLGKTRYYCVDGLVPAAVPAQKTDAVGAVRAVAAAHPGPIRWVGMGPLTNLARVLVEAPEVAARLRVTQMGGALRYRDPERAEHNFRLDVPAVHEVFAAVAEGRLPTPEFVTSEITFVPDIKVTPDHPVRRRLAAPDAPPWAHLLHAHLDRWFAGSGPLRIPGTLQHDGLTLSAALRLPYVDSRPMPLSVDAIGRTTRTPEGSEGTVVRVSVAARYAAFMTWLETTLDPAATPSGPFLP